MSTRICSAILLAVIASTFLSTPSLLAQTSASAENGNSRAEYIRSNYSKFEYRIPMRDGTKLFTSVYMPLDATERKKYPVIMVRTPYSVAPYGADVYRTRLGPSEAFEQSGYIFVFQDVRGCYMSEGDFINMRPHLEDKQGDQFDESTDTYDTIEWITQNIPFNNGRFGQWGISYPGFFTAAGAIDSHPGLKCISPQAPIGDWFWDDMHRNGAFNVQLAATFFSSFGRVRSGPTTERADRIDLQTDDAYQFFLDLGPLKNLNEIHFKREIPFWNAITEHPNYDYFWQSRNLIPHLKNVHCASLVVGGWFDTEDLYGPLKIYDSIETNNPQIENSLVMGPWYHGGWNGAPGDKLGDASFDWATAEWYREEVEFPFFEKHLKSAQTKAIAEATVFETGANRWRKFNHWPPTQVQEAAFYLAPDGQLSENAPTSDTTGSLSPEEPHQSELASSDADRYLSDPNKPVPYTQEISSRWARDYMTEDQRFAARRPDVLVYRSAVLEEDLTIAGPLQADLWFSSTSTAADVVVKLIDEFPGRPEPGSRKSESSFQSGRQQLVRGQVMRTRFRESYEYPRPLTPNQPENIQFELHDVLHTFKRGHRVMIQVQSTWFPFVDRNPQKYVANIFEATEDDFVTATHSVYRTADMPSAIRFKTLGKP